MLPHLVEWQKRNDYPVMFACEATLNIAKQTDILELMKEANFVGMFVGIETPEADALDAIKKGHNNAVPMMESIRTLNSYGIEITSGIILGLDSETPDTEQRLKDFIDVSQIPMLTINLLQALPKTPLWDRLKRDGRLLDDDSRESNVVFLRPHDEVVGDVAPLDRLRERSRKAVRALPPSGRGDLCEPQGDAGEGQAHLEQPARRRRDGMARAVASLPAVGFPQAVLAHGQARAASKARSTA